MVGDSYYSMSYIQDTIEEFEELTKAGECNLDVPIKIYGLLKNDYPELATKFSHCYTQFYNDEIDELPSDLYTEVIEKLKLCPEPPPQIDKFADLSL